MAITSSIATNMPSVRATNIFNQSQTNMNTTFEKVSTGLRIRNVADSPSDWAISEKMRERVNSLNQVNQNIQNDTAMMKTASDGISNTLDILKTLKARVLNGMNAAANDGDRQTLANEVNSLLDQVETNARSVKYNGLTLLDGTYAKAYSDVATEDEDAGGEEEEGTGEASVGSQALSFQIGEESGLAISVGIGDLTLYGLGLSDYITAATSETEEGDEEEAATTTITPARGAVTAEMFQTVGTTDEDGAASSPATDFLNAIDTAINRALEAATNAGSLEARLGYTAENVATQSENLLAADSAIRDADMAQGISTYMRQNVQTQAAQYMLAQMNQNAFSILNLLQ